MERIMEEKIYWLYFDPQLTAPEDLQDLANYMQDTIDGLVLFLPKSFDVKIMDKKTTLAQLQKMIDYINEKWDDKNE